MDDKDYTIDLSDITIGNVSTDTSFAYEDWLAQYDSNLDLNFDSWYPNSSLGADDIKLTAAGDEMLRVAKDGFYVRGVKVEADAKEAEAVYKAFKQWMTYAILNSEINN